MMQYPFTAITEDATPHAQDRLFQHVLDIYASEINKVVSTWRAFADKDLPFRPHPKSGTAEEIMKHELLSQRRFFAEFLGTAEPPGANVLPDLASVAAYWQRLRDLALPRLMFLANQKQEWWLEEVDFFDVRRERIWIFWRRVLHTAHHRTQLTVYLRLLGYDVPAIYGPTADISWTGADPTQTVEAAERR
jgi:uncharacterized damage-inducible protein DinB